MDYRIEVEFPKAIKLLERVSQHREHIVNTFQIRLLNGISNRRRMLDVGAGAGQLTERIASHFAEADVVEPNSEFAKILAEKGFTVINQSFENMVPTKRYDFVLCSHVLYHVDRTQFTPFLENFMKCLSNDGVGLIAMKSAAGFSDKFHRLFGEDYCHSGLIAEVLKNLEVNFDTVRVINTMRMAAREELVSILRFFAIADGITVEKFLSMSTSEKNALFVRLEHFIDSIPQDLGWGFEQPEDHFIVFPN